MHAKIAEIANITAQKDKVQKMYEELKDKQAKIKKQGEIEVQEMALKQRDKDAEIEVLKEMIKGIKVQVKCKFLKQIMIVCSEGHRYPALDDKD